MDTYYNLEIFLHRDIFNEYVAKIGKIFQKLKKIKQKNENKDIFFTIFEYVIKMGKIFQKRKRMICINCLDFK